MRRIGLLGTLLVLLLALAPACNPNSPQLEKIKKADGDTGKTTKEGTAVDAGPDKTGQPDKEPPRDRNLLPDLKPPKDETKPDQKPPVDVTPPPDVAPDQKPPIDVTPPPDLQPDTPPADQGGKPGEPCKTPCDCKQGFDCQNNVCTKATLPIYCCEKQGCPANETCVNKSGQKGKCIPKPQCVRHCDCPQGLACFAGTCRNVGSPILCCDKPGCTPGTPCYTKGGLHTTCKGSGPTQCKHTCDCPQGQSCLNGTCFKGQQPSYCCDNANCPAASFCEYRVGGYGYCPKNNNQIKCNTSCDCKLGEICFSGACVRSQNPVYCCDRDKNVCPAGGLCEEKNGSKRICGSYTKCNNTCDCQDKEICFNGRCISSQQPTPCCTSKLCRKGQFCIEPSGSFGQCK